MSAVVKEKPVRNYRCGCGEMFVDVVAQHQVESTGRALGYALRPGCSRCESLKLIDVVRGIYTVKEST